MMFVAALATMLNVLGAQRALGQSSTPREETWVTNGAVEAIVRTTDTIYIGGNFTYVGPNTGSGVPLDNATGQPVATFPKVNGTVNASVSDGIGGWYIGGSFTPVGGEARNRIAPILARGTVDPAWNPHAHNTPQSPEQAEGGRRPTAKSLPG